ncbi:hypothetical protein ACPC3F_04210, partial [Streptomyces xanthochromogenes]
MTKNTRVRFARIAAGAVIAAGASLTAAGAAQAVGADSNESKTASVLDDPCSPTNPLCLPTTGGQSTGSTTDGTTGSTTSEGTTGSTTSE